MPGIPDDAVVITHAVRTPVGRFLGQFSELSAVDLGVEASAGLFRRASLDPAKVDAAIFGCARQAGLGPNPGRQVAVRAGVPVERPAITVNMACGSGLWALIQAAQMIRLGEARVVLAGGFENMTRVPFLLPQMRKGYRLGNAPLVDAMYQDGFHCPLADQLMGETAETLARKYSIPREEQDAFAARSQQRFEAARKAGRVSAEIVPVSVPQKGGGRAAIDRDEHPRDGVTGADLAKLAPVFDPNGGCVTAGNASGIADGAAALVVASARSARELGAPVLAVFEAHASAGVDPKVMGLGPVPATRALMEKVGRKPGDYDLVELNEAFAAQVLACDREIRFDPERLNVNGGSIALGHPIGGSGARIVVTLLHEMKRRGAGLGLATLCISGGQGLSASFAAAKN
jgi:acetyl-CoA C-acetyltransferase